MKRNITKPFIGLHTDNSVKEQPKDTYRFALNAVNETEDGDTTFTSNEESNELCINLPNNYVPIGKVYIGSNRTVIFSVSPDNSVSEIGIMKGECKYETVVNDSQVTNVDNKLNFKVTNQIDATYRLRRGCDDTIYFTDNLNPPRYFNISQPEDFKDTDGNWVGRSFNLIKSYNRIPRVESVEVVNNQGNLPPGSISVLIQYLDDDFNGTPFLTEIPGINIYHDNTKDRYSDIEGSLDLKEEAYAYGKTNKAIRIQYSNFDESYNFYRLAFVHYSNNTGRVSEVIYSSPISTKTDTFLYTGDNGAKKGTIEEIQLADNNGAIQKAESIEQIENKLVLANTKGQEVEFCKIQKYASKIKADCVLKDILLTTVSEKHNSKNPLVKFNGLSYQPGEVYSFGIIYMFKDMTFSPVFHIPGKNPDIDRSMTFTTGDNVHPMDNVNNFNATESYTDNSSCNSNNFWGVDSEGKPLLNKKVRHHKFPTRNELGVSFVEKVNEQDAQSSNFSNLRLWLNGNIKTSVTCPQGATGCTAYDAPDFRLTVTYKLDGVDQIFQATINPDGTVPAFVDSPVFLSSANVTDIKLFYTDATVARQAIALTGNESAEQPNKLTYKLEVVNSSEDSTEDIYKAPIFGIKFSNIELPPKEVTGKECIGYCIVRQERTKQDRTILDSGVILPTVKNANFIASGMLAPEFDNSCEQEVFANNHCYRTSKQNLQLLAPLHKFTDETYDSFTKLEEQGFYKPVSTAKTGISIQNVYDGSSAEGVKTNESTSDNDGYTLRNIIRSTKVSYNTSGTDKFETDNSNTKLFNLNGVSSFKHDNNTDTFYNLPMGNKALIVSKNNQEDLRTYRPNKNVYPYVYIKSEKQSFYSNFRVNPYYSQTVNLQTEDTIEIYQGDIHIAPLRYDNHVFCNAVAGTRRESLGFWKGFLAVLTVVVGVVAAVFSGGSSLVLAGGILTALAGVAMGAASVIEVGDFNDLYKDKWMKGLDKTAYDKFYHRHYVDPNINKFGPLQWRDDTFKWYGDILGDLWFETPINISLRVSPGTDNGNFLKPLKSFMPDRPDKLATLRSIGENDDDWDNADDYYYYRDVTVGADSKEENYFLNKITEIDSKRKSGYLYKGVSIPKIYLLNVDHNVQKNVKVYFHLPLEYDCCSDCNETFPHRWYWSETSFQEELTDNYRTFLPNNYKDLDGENGVIRNVFKLNNELYIHTEEGLWLQPRNHQERVTDQIVSFIGTGEFGSVPPKRIIDDDTGLSAGTHHKWSTIKTPYGYFYVSENEAKIYQFTGKLKAISDVGIENWFQNNTSINLDKQYYKSNDKVYPYKDNPSNPFGTGFIMTYDTTKERIIVTKKDKSFSSNIQNQQGFDICVNNNNLTIFLNVAQTVQQQANNGYTYEGLDNCRMKFYKDVLKTRTEIRNIKKQVKISNNADIWVMLDMSGSFNNNDRQEITDAVNQWKNNFAASNPDWQGTLRIYSDSNGARSENWIQCLDRIFEHPDYNGQDMSQKDIIVVSFVNENGDPNYGRIYHPQDITNPIPPVFTHFSEDRQAFINKYNQLKSFNGILYPIIRGSLNWSRAFLQHALGAIKGSNYSQAEIDSIPKNPAINDSQWNTIKTSLVTNNPYGIALSDYNWQGQWNRTGDTSGSVIDATQFQEDINTLLEGINETVIETVEVEIEYIDREYIYVDGEVVEDPVELINDWTLSYSLKREKWISWHSYLPNFYVHQAEKFFSWIHGKQGLWKHNKKGHYQTFYGKYYPFIIEYISLSTPLQTRIWDDIKLHTEAKKYIQENGSYVDERFKTFNKAILYNSRQCTGLMTLRVKDEQNPDSYLLDQVVNLDSNTIIIDRNERDWTLNEIRDIRIDYTKPIFNEKIDSVQDEYFIDKVLNESTLDINKDWQQMESLRDKYLAVRLIFDNFDDVNLLINYSEENEIISQR